MSPLHVSKTAVLPSTDQIHERSLYHGNAHFTAHWHDHLGVWWKHDGRKHCGAPVVNTINDESDLHQCDGSRMTLLIYSFQHDT